jgi:hypothetical protein
MPRYVLLARSADAGNDLERIRQTPGVTVVDEAGRRSLLIDATEELVSELRASLENWMIEEEVSYARPGPHQYRIGKK